MKPFCLTAMIALNVAAGIYAAPSLSGLGNFFIAGILAGFWLATVINDADGTARGRVTS